MLPNARGSDEKIPLFVTNQSVEEIATLSQTTHQPGSDAIVEEAKAAGDTLYRQQKWQEARDAYSQGVHLHANDLNLRKLLLLNLAATNLQLGDILKPLKIQSLYVGTGNWEDVLRNTATVLLADPKSAKALYRAARALNELKRSEEAYDCCTRLVLIYNHNISYQAIVFTDQ
ncbi:hypothetical protein RhiJN_27406 [Ceratobasidium sp. AG-Ba]|nr:hypothetical protein RhiJN_13334 [Ceratobasidium sp. AG-Ba]QRV99387.1 hypothetical protein RhiJN_27406 [Ceratobasidium sp. AG-Ba]